MVAEMLQGCKTCIYITYMYTYKHTSTRYTRERYPQSMSVYVQHKYSCYVLYSSFPDRFSKYWIRYGITESEWENGNTIQPYHTTSFTPIGNDGRFYYAIFSLFVVFILFLFFVVCDSVLIAMCPQKTPTPTNNKHTTFTER